MISNLEGEKAPDMSAEELKQLKQQATRKQTATPKSKIKPKAKRTAPSTPAVKAAPRIRFEDLPHRVEIARGWAPRVTRYFLAGSKELTTTMHSKNFSRQSPEDPLELDNWVIQELGALYDKDSLTNFRIVEAKEKK